jgi:hypothetical protein
MKKIFFILMLFLSVEMSGQISLGVKGGLNINQLILPPTIGLGHAISNADLGYFVGVSAEYEKNNFIIDCSLLFNNKKGRWEYYKEYDGFDGSLTDNINYLSLPITGGYKFDFIEDMKLVCLAGISMNYKLNSYEKFRIYGEGERADFGYRRYKKFPLGLVLTCGVETGRARISMGYDIGLTHALTTNYDAEDGVERKGYMRNFIMSVKYFF